jgi:hypothetical protein
MREAVQKRVLSRIYGKGRGWVFCPTDFVDLSNRNNVDTALGRLVEKGTIRRLYTGIYDYPTSKDGDVDIANAAKAIAKRWGWVVEFGVSRENETIYWSNGPKKSYVFKAQVLTFRKKSKGFCGTRPDWYYSKYGVTSEKFEEMEKAQGNKCAICGKLSKTKLCVDHDHVTGNVRGLLCRLCNSGLGFFLDNIESPEYAIKYLEISKR